MQEFRGMALQSHGPQQAGRPWIGLEHTNKVWIIVSLLKSKCRKIQTTPKLSEKIFSHIWCSPTLLFQANKRSRYTYMEKSIKIYNWAWQTPPRWTPSSVKQSETRTSESFRLQKWCFRVERAPCATASVWSVPGATLVELKWQLFFLDCSKCIFLLLAKQHRREVYLLIYIDILTSLHQGCKICLRWCRHSYILFPPRPDNTSYWKSHYSYSIHPLPPGFWTGGDLSLTVTSLGHLDFYGLIYSIYWCTLSSSNWTVLCQKCGWHTVKGGYSQSGIYPGKCREDFQFIDFHLWSVITCSILFCPRVSISEV